MRLPNGYGSVYKLNGKRRKPYAAVSTYYADGKQRHKYLGYFTTKAEALNFLADYNKNPTYCSDITFGEIYEDWLKSKDGTISTRTEQSYLAQKIKLQPIYDKQIRKISLNEIQMLYDECGTTTFKSVLTQVYDYAIQHDFVEKNIVTYIKTKPKPDKKIHYRFTMDEINILWSHSDDKEIKVILLLIYTGMRPSELFDTELRNVNLEERYIFVQKGKTKNATRKVPIHNAIYDMVCEMYQSSKTYLVEFKGRKLNITYYAEPHFEPALERCGLLTYQLNGETDKHLPYDTRHTFTTMWMEKNLNEGMRRYIQGHSGKGIGEKVYTHYSMESLLEELNKL